jgi:hypothetical protein
VNTHEALAIIALHRHFPGLVKPEAVYDALVVLTDYRMAA